MENQIKHTVVVLPSKNNESPIDYNHIDDKFSCNELPQFQKYNPKHLYIISDEKPTIGDWSVNLNSPYEHKELCTIDNEIELERYVILNNGSDCRKVISSTDPKIGLKIPKVFIEKWVNEKNIGNTITEVLVDYGILLYWDWATNYYFHWIEGEKRKLSFREKLAIKYRIVK